MVLSYRDNRFWEKFHAEHWGPRVPTVIRQPFKEFPFSEPAVLRALNFVDERVREGDRRIRYQVSVGKVDKAPRRRLMELIPHESKTLEQLEKEVVRAFPKENFGLMLNELQSLDPDIWGGAAAFLQDAHQLIDFPVPGAFLDLFFGNYASSFVGLHKDIQEIFAFVLRGEKRILAWPFDYFAKVEGLTPAAKYFQMRLAVDYRKHRKHAVVLDACPGDVIYWPADHWHIAEGKPGSFTTMLSLGITRPDYVIPLQDPKRIRFKQKLLSHGAPQSQDMTGDSTGPGAARQLRWVTGLGFELGAPITSTPRRKTGTEVVKKRKSTLLLWTLNPSSGRVLVAANAHSLTLPHSPGVVSVLERLAKGESVSVPHFPLRGGGESAKMFETNWDNEGKLKTHARAITRDLESSVVDWLRRVHAVDVE